jgi:hypothetical protein
MDRSEKQGWWVRWVGANALAEGLGLGSSALLWGAFFFLGLEARLGIIGAAALVVAGSTLLEGSAVGLTQWIVLRRLLPDLPRHAWWLATAIGAGIAWTLGMIPSTLFSLAEADTGAAPTAEPAAILMYGLAALMGLMLGPVLAMPQWFVLRRFLRRAWVWIPANAAAWGVGMPLIFVAMDLIQPTALTAGVALALLFTLALVGATVGAIHGAILLHLSAAQRAMERDLSVA